MKTAYNNQCRENIMYNRFLTLIMSTAKRFGASVFYSSVKIMKRGNDRVKIDYDVYVTKLLSRYIYIYIYYIHLQNTIGLTLDEHKLPSSIR